MKKIIVEMAYCSDEYFTETAEYIVVTLSSEKKERIKTLSAAVRVLEADRITEYDYDCVFKVSDKNSNSAGKVSLKKFKGRMECETLNVRKDDFFWSGNYRNTGVLWETDSIPLFALDEPGDYDQRNCCSNESGDNEDSFQ